MPTYDYECTKCERRFELFQSIRENPKRRIKTDCSQCNDSAPVKRLIGTGGGVIFRGSGFYQTDYRSESYKAAAKKESDKASGKDKGSTDTKDKKKTGTDSAPTKSESSGTKNDK